MWRAAGERKFFLPLCALVWVGKNNIFIISWRIHSDIYMYAEKAVALSTPHIEAEEDKAEHNEKLFL